MKLKILKCGFEYTCDIQVYRYDVVFLHVANVFTMVTAPPPSASCEWSFVRHVIISPSLIIMN